MRGESTSPGMFHIPLTRSCVYTWRKSSVKLSCMHFACKGTFPLCEGRGFCLSSVVLKEQGMNSEWTLSNRITESGRENESVW